MSPLAVERAWRSGHERFGDVALLLDVFREYLAQRAELLESRDAGGEIVHAADLYLACACAQGDRRAHSHLYAVLRPIVVATLTRFGQRAPDVDEILSRVGERLLATRVGAPARISRYDGSHALATWTRIITLRIVLDRLAPSNRERPVEDAILEGLGALDAGPETTALRARDRTLARSAIERACQVLDRRARRMLRHAFVERLTIDEVGELYGFHRSTAARAIRKAVDALIAATHAELSRLGGSQVDEISRIEVTLERLLRSTIEDCAPP